MHFDFVIPVLYSPEDISFYDALAARLEQHGCAVGLLALTRDGERALRKTHPHVFYLYEGFEGSRPASPAEMTAVEKRYRLGSLGDHVYPEHKYWARPIAELSTRAVHVFRYLETFLAEHTVSLFVNNIGGEIIRRCMARIAEAGGPKNLIVDFAPLHGRIALTTLETGWDDLPARPPALSPAERQFTEELCGRVTNDQKMFCAPSKLGLRPQNFLRALQWARVLFLDEQIDFSLSHMYYERVERVVRRGINPRFYEQPVPGERYLFFPLHLAIDSAITLRAPQFQRQENLVEYIAERALPSGTKLYVKPHVGARDAYSIPMMIKLARIPNVRLIEPTVNSHALIRGAEAMVVINSTVGFESLFYGKPVVVLGRVFYRGFGVTTDLENLADLRRAVAQALDNPPDREAILRFLHACYLATSPGIFSNKTDQNLENVSRALIAKAARLRVPIGGQATSAS